ncbi:MAG: hypothetical protein K2M96_09920 [Prevotella sp.]|nr:hypothetical protein [Prevotella sp.]
MKKKFYPNDGRCGISVSSIDEIRDYMGDLRDYLNTIEIKNGIVIANIEELPVTLGRIENEP